MTAPQPASRLQPEHCKPVQTRRQSGTELRPPPKRMLRHHRSLAPAPPAFVAVTSPVALPAVASPCGSLRGAHRAGQGRPRLRMVLPPWIEAVVPLALIATFIAGMGGLQVRGRCPVEWQGGLSAAAARARVWPSAPRACLPAWRPARGARVATPGSRDPLWPSAGPFVRRLLLRQHRMTAASSSAAAQLISQRARRRAAASGSRRSRRRLPPGLSLSEANLAPAPTCACAGRGAARVLWQAQGHECGRVGPAGGAPRRAHPRRVASEAGLSSRCTPAALSGAGIQRGDTTPVAPLQLRRASTTVAWPRRPLALLPCPALLPSLVHLLNLFPAAPSLLRFPAAPNPDCRPPCHQSTLAKG